jgi:hypothetical protein
MRVINSYSRSLLFFFSFPFLCHGFLFFPLKGKKGKEEKDIKKETRKRSKRENP